MSRLLSGSLFAILFLGLLAPLGAQTKLLRYPDLHDDTIVFSYAGDLWKATVRGGTAVRLTAHPGREIFPRISPDGSMVAFTGQYDGDEQVYVMPITGGEPKQLTFYPARGPLPTRWGFDHQVYGWTADGTQVLFRSMRYGWDLTDTKLFTVPLTGGLPTPLEMPVAGGGDLSPDDSKVVYSPLTRDFRSWKRYEGGWAQDLWIFDRKTNTAQQITDDKRTERDPMWIGDSIWYASDSNGTLNLWRFDIKAGKNERVTDSTRWDIRWPTRANDARIVYELNGEIEIFDANSRTAQQVKITVPTDGLAARPSRISARGNMEQWNISPDGKRAVVAARGDIFSVPVGKGPTRNLTADVVEHAKWPSWSPDGKSILFISDRSGEEELWMVAQDGRSAPEQLTTGGTGMRYRATWSPKGTHAAFSDKDGKLHVLTLEGKKLTEVADEQSGFLNDFAWSPCGGHIAFSMQDHSTMRSIYIWSAGDGQVRRVTGQMSSEYNPAWGPDGDYLYFLSPRTYAPQIGFNEWNYVLDRPEGIFAMALRKDVAHPFPPESEEVEIESDGDEDEKKDDEKGDGPIVIDFEGLGSRVARVPVGADNYGSLGVVKGHLVYSRTGPFYYGRGSDVRTELRAFSLKSREVHTIIEGSSPSYAVSHDGKQMLVFKGGTLHRVDAAKKGGSPKALDLGGLVVDRDPRAEIAHVYDEVFRRFRDFFYARNMHGYDWQALRDQYAEWLPHIRHRDDLNYVISELIGELNVGHAYISGGDFEMPERRPVGLLGAEFAVDAAANKLRIAKILEGQNEEDAYRSPLTEIGVNVSEGDYLLAIDGLPVDASSNPYSMLRERATHPIRLTVSANADGSNPRDVTVRPIRSEGDLRYIAMVEGNRRKVEEMTGGRVGYIHIPDMGAGGIAQFIKTYYPQIRKEGMIVDVRNNGGGNVSQMILERLGRKLLGTGKARSSDRVTTYPYQVFHGHMVCLLNENSASDGDIFPYRFREKGLGPLIGKRSWGGVIGIAGRGPLLDGGDVRVPEFGFMNAKGEWVIEGVGVAPDIEVANDPASVIAGEDRQLERGVAEVLKAMEAEPRKLPTPAPDPVRTK